MCGMMLRDKKSPEELRKGLDIESVLTRGRLRLFGHVEREEESDWLKANSDFVI